uniref:Uncharacterized protein n=1 Tax=Populus davidiana TaxID=266767 RepID=A0A6M2F776_9ROSI
MEMLPEGPRYMPVIMGTLMLVLLWRLWQVEGGISPRDWLEGMRGMLLLEGMVIRRMRRKDQIRQVVQSFLPVKLGVLVVLCRGVNYMFQRGMLQVYLLKLLWKLLLPRICIPET